MNIETALKICVTGHAGQVDKAGECYSLHPITVMMKLKHAEYTEDYLVVALLHDILEDTYLTLEDLRKEGISSIQEDALLLLTKSKNVDYFDYINALKSNDIARAVKIYDLKHNMEITRLKTITEHDIKRIQKYHKALNILTNIK
jgi:(p)ppGpp synthase/HD superfamily hydrolase